MSAANAANIGLVSNNNLTEVAMVDTVALLQGAGHTVTWIGAGTVNGTLTTDYTGPGSVAGQTKKEYLETFDAIIICRSAGSAQFVDQAGWAGLEVGVLSGNGYAVRGSPVHLVWFSSTQGETGTVGNPDTTVVDAAHEIFQGVTTPNNLWVDPNPAGLMVSAMTAAGTYGSGHLVASAAGNNGHAIVTWNAGDTFSNNLIVAKRRVFFALMGRNSSPGDQTANAVSLTADGQKAFLNAINWVMVDEEVPDVDGDGLPDAWELQHFRASETETEAQILAKWSGTDDPDGDGFNNLAELAGNSDPNNPTSVPGDVDGDGLPDAWELANFGNLLQTADGDFDHDMATNGQEHAASTNPASALSWPDADLDGMNDAWEVLHGFNPASAADAAADTDGDGFSNLQEFLAGSDPKDATWTPVNAKLKHRWSFNNSLDDSVGGSHATIVDPDVDVDPATPGGATLGAQGITLEGGAKATSSYVSLGTNLLSSLAKDRPVPITIELWATQNAIQNWSRIFDIGTDQGAATTAPPTNGTLMMSWTNGTNINNDQVLLSGVGASNNTNYPYVLNNKFHIVMTIVPAMHDGSTLLRGSRVTWYSAPAPTAEQPHPIGVSRGSFTTTADLSQLLDAVAYLGRSMYSGDNTASATYDEMRIWLGALTETERKLFHLIGPDNINRADSDADGYPDAWELAYFGNLTTASTTGDTDGDGDSDHDEFLAESNPNSATSTPDDVDGDGLPDTWERQHFRNLLSKPDQDPDGDTYSNLVEYLAGSSPTDANSTPDSDGDGIEDGWELEHFGNLTTANATSNFDGDFDTDLEEFLGGFDPTDKFSGRDTDTDGLNDFWEFTYFNVPSNPNTQFYLRYTGTDDPDNDGATNAEEFAAETDPTDPNSYPDVNDDGLPDGRVLNATDALGATSFNAGTNWRGGLAPAAGNRYLVYQLTLRTPNVPNQVTAFAGDNLTISSGTLLGKGNNSTVSANFILDAATIRNGNDAQNSSITLDGTIAVKSRADVPEQVSTLFADNGALILNALVSGDGNLVLNGQAAAFRSVQFNNPGNTYSGNLTVGPTANLVINGALNTGSANVFSFAPSTNGVNNSIGGTAPFVIKGIFDINLDNASTQGGSSWTLVSNAQATYDAAFTVEDFTSSGGAAGSRIWTSGDFEFSEATGILRNTSEVIGYDGWASLNALPPASSGPEQNPDGDPFENVLEYQLGGNPLAFDGDLVTATEDATHLIFTFERYDLSETDTTLNFRWSTDLSNWNTVLIGAVSSPANANGVTVNVTEGGGSNADYDLVVVRLPKTNAVGGKLFGQLQGTRP